MIRVLAFARELFLQMVEVTLQVWRLEIRSSARGSASSDWTETVWRDLLFQALTPAFGDCADLVIQQEHDISLSVNCTFVSYFSIFSLYVVQISISKASPRHNIGVSGFCCCLV